MDYVSFIITEDKAGTLFTLHLYRVKICKFVCNEETPEKIHVP